jgi:hypothetical protein
MVVVKMEYGFGSVGKENHFRSSHIFFPKKRKETSKRLIVWNSFHIYIPVFVYKFYSSPKSVSVIKWRRIGWVGHVEQLGEMRSQYAISDEIPDHFGESESESESYVTTDGQPARLSWNKAPIWGLRPDLYYLCDSYGLLLVGRPLWREVGSVFCMCCWPLPTPLGLETIFYCLTFETSLFIASYDSQGHGGGIRPSLHTVGLRWPRYILFIYVFFIDVISISDCIESTGTAL